MLTDMECRKAVCPEGKKFLRMSDAGSMYLQVDANGSKRWFYKYIDLLKPLNALTGHGRLVFPGERDHDRPISDNSVRTALITMGYTSDLQTWHGFRATARTLLAEKLNFDPNIIEAQLAHAVKDVNGRAYNRTTYLEQRTKMMQSWADYLDALAVGAKVISLQAA